MKKVLFTVLALAALVLVSSCDKKSNENNPFMSEYANEYGIPPFDKITYGDYMPAVEAGIAEQNAEIDSIIKNTAVPNFENTILALDNSGRILDKVSRVFNALSSSDNTEEMQKLSEDLLPMLTKQSDGMYMNDSLFAKVKAVLKRYEKTATVSGDKLVFGDISIDLDAGTVSRNGSAVELTAMEYKLLAYLVVNRNKVVEKQDIFDKVWNDSFVTDGTLNVHIRHLREKLEADPNDPTFIKTARGRGYIFKAE